MHGLFACSELLAKERNDHYWRFLDQWLEAGESAKLQTDKECVQHIEEKGSSLLGAPLSPLFRLSLSLRSASPKLVVYRQLATESLAVHDSGRKVNASIPASLFFCISCLNDSIKWLLIWQLEFPVIGLPSASQVNEFCCVLLCFVTQEKVLKSVVLSAYNRKGPLAVSVCRLALAIISPDSQQWCCCTF